jgi:hypothetical protein
MSKCQWIGNGEGCTHEAVEGRSYCQEHLYKVYQKGTNLGKRKKDLRIVDDVRLMEQLLNEVVEELENEGFL